MVALFFILVLPAILILQSHSDQEVGNYDMSSSALTGPYGPIEDFKKLFVKEVASKFNPNDLMTGSKLDQILNVYNDQIAPKLNTNDDSVDAVIKLLPESYRRHFSLIHRSFSIQKATPTSPRVILYGPDAKVMMTFNAGVDVDGKIQDGGQSIEVIEWDTRKRTWNFSEITFDLEKRALHNKDPKKCVMCHAGTPKPVNFANIDAYKGKLKPIFPQYPFWPGFYGSVNDIVGLKELFDDNGNAVPIKTFDSIMLKEEPTLKQVRGLTFENTEELFRLSYFLKSNPKYLDVVRNELKIHQDHFAKFMKGSKSRSRYQHLVTLDQLYKNQGKPVPPFLLAAPYRRTFDKVYGHYLLRPNFYLSSLLTFYHSQFVADQIQATPVFNQIKNSLLARKFNCKNIEVDGLKLSDLDPSFDLLYPNVSSQESMDRQYLLAYQYNIEAAVKKGQKPLPLFAWNMESNEDIASYHYGNVFSDMNELVLWQLATRNFPNLTKAESKSASELDHYGLPNSTYLQDFLDGAQGRVSRMDPAQYAFANSTQNYYGTNRKFNALPVSKYCDSHFLPAARAELKQLSERKATQQLPHQLYVLNSQLINFSDILDPGLRPGLNMVRQACESCHTDNSLPESEHIKPRINVDWFSNTYHQDIKVPYTRIDKLNQNPVPLKNAIDDVLSQMTLPVPYGNAMPLARRPLDAFSLKCELLVIQAQYENDSEVPLKGKAFGCNKAEDPNSLGCRCQRLSLRKDRIYEELFPKN